MTLAVRAAARGETFLSSTVSAPILDSVLSEQAETGGQTPFDRLSAREKQVLKLIAEGETNHAIARIMDISVKTVEKHRTNLMTKLNAHDTAALVRMALKHKLIFMEE